MLLRFLSELLKKNVNFEYHIAVIIIFSLLYYLLSVGKYVGDEEDERFQNRFVTLLHCSNTFHNWLR